MTQVTRAAAHERRAQTGQQRVFSQDGRGEVLFTAFDVSGYTHNARGRIVIDTKALSPLNAVNAADLAFLWRLDSAGLSEARSMLSCWTGNEARITAFVATWSFERMWLARAVKEALEASGVRPDPRHRGGIGARLRERWVDRLMPLMVPPIAAAVGEPFTAGHMIRMALQEVSLRAAYVELLPRLDGEAHRVVEEIIERRAAFVDFYHLEASARIARSRLERNCARLALVGWQPLRIVGVPDPDERRALGSIFLGRDAVARLRAAQRPTLELLHGTGLMPGTDRDGDQPPPPSPGLLTPRRHHGL